MRKKGYVTHPLEIMAFWLRYQPQLLEIGGYARNHNNMSLVTLTNILSMLKKWDETHSLVGIQAVWLHAPLLAIYMRKITYLCIMVWIHMDSHKYIFGSHNRKYINYGSSHRFSLPFWSMCPWTRMLINWESYSPPILDTMLLPYLPTLKFEMKYSLLPSISQIYARTWIHFHP